MSYWHWQTLAKASSELCLTGIGRLRQRPVQNYVLLALADSGKGQFRIMSYWHWQTPAKASSVSFPACVLLLPHCAFFLLLATSCSWLCCAFALCTLYGMPDTLPFTHPAFD